MEVSRWLVKVNTDIAVYNRNYHTAMGSHSVTCHPVAVTFLHLPQPMLVVDLVTPEGYRAELTVWWLHPKIVYPPKTVTCLRNNQAVS